MVGRRGERLAQRRPHRGRRLALSFKDTGLAFGETRHYRVAARNSRGLSDWSYPPYAMATTPSGVPGQPRLTARAPSSDIIDLEWTVPDDNGLAITVYDIQWSEDGRPGGWKDLTPPLAGRSGRCRPLPTVMTVWSPVTTRYYRIRAVNGAGAGSWSQAAHAGRRSR